MSKAIYHYDCMEWKSRYTFDRQQIIVAYADDVPDHDGSYTIIPNGTPDDEAQINIRLV